MISSEILDGIGDAILGLAPDWTITFFNRKAEEFLGKSRAEVIGRDLWQCFPAAVGGELEATFRGVMRSRAAKHREAPSPTSGRWVDLRVFPLEGGGIVADWRDITDRKAQEIALQEAVENQDMLFRELAHRVTNNFQEVAARVGLQGRDLQDPVAREMCEKMAISIRCMALVHRRLYRSGRRIDDQDLGDYVRALCEDLSSSLPSNITLSSVIEAGAQTAVDIATTVGMMVAELVMNSRKYAWAPGQPGRMVVTVRRDGDFIEIELWDDGRGVPEGMDLHKSAGLGLKLLELQIKRLNGAFTYRNVQGGTIFLLRFPDPGVIRRKIRPHRARATSGARAHG
jgi:PAS domain S-box-containing protein